MNNLRLLSKVKALKVLSNPVLVRSLQTSSILPANVHTSDWLPGKRPETKEEIAKAAKKYNMLPEEYEPQPDDGFNTGDYPHLPSTNQDNRDPFYPWDYPQFRVNFGEPLPDDFMVKTYAFVNDEEDCYNRIPMWEQALSMVVFGGGFMFFIWFFMQKYRYYYPKFDSPLAKDGVVHYGYHKKQ